MEKKHNTSWILDRICGGDPEARKLFGTLLTKIEMSGRFNGLDNEAMAKLLVRSAGVYGHLETEPEVPVPRNYWNETNLNSIRRGIGAEIQRRRQTSGGV